MKLRFVFTLFIAGLSLQTGAQTLPEIEDVKMYIHPLLKNIPPGLVYTTESPESGIASSNKIIFYSTHYNNNGRIAKIETHTAADYKQKKRLKSYALFTYNNLGNVLTITRKEEYLSEQKEYFSYNAEGYLWRKDAPNSSTNYKYKNDNKGRITESFFSTALNNIKKSFSTKRTFKYDDKDRMIFSDETNGKKSKKNDDGYRFTEYAYDGKTGLPAYIQTFNRNEAVIMRKSASYDANGNLQKTNSWNAMFGGNGESVYTWNQAGLVTEMLEYDGKYKTSISYDEQNRMVSKLKENYNKSTGTWGIAESSTFDWEKTTDASGKSEITGKEKRTDSNKKTTIIYHVLKKNG